VAGVVLLGSPAGLLAQVAAPVPGGTVANNSVGDPQFPGKAKGSGTAVPNPGSQVDGVRFVIGTNVPGVGFVPLAGPGASAAGVPGPGNTYTAPFALIPKGNYVMRMNVRWRPNGQLAPVVIEPPVDQPITIK
jgi:hypothetical protein